MTAVFAPADGADADAATRHKQLFSEWSFQTVDAPATRHRRDRRSPVSGKPRRLVILLKPPPISKTTVINAKTILDIDVPA